MLAAAVPAPAGTLQIDPILIEIGDARKTGAITETRIADAAKLQTIGQAADAGGRQLSQSGD